MTKLTWDLAGGRLYEAGIDRGVLYLPSGAVPWNGLSGVDEDAADASTPLYFDGLKYADLPANEDFSGTLRVFTYPDEFLAVDGSQSLAPGLYVDSQPLQTFGLSYRTRLGNDVDGVTHGYRIHLLYNLVAVDDTQSYATLSNSVNALEFSWQIHGRPETLTTYKPTAHAIIDSTRINKYLLADLENTLYGSSSAAPSLPSLQSLVDMAKNYMVITITDNGDGTWTATGPDDLVYMTDSTSFQIDQVNATYGTSEPYSADTYTISSTPA